MKLTKSKTPAVNSLLAHCIWFSFLFVLGTKPQALFLLGMHSTTDWATSRGPVLERDLKNSKTGHCSLLVSVKAGASMLAAALSSYLNQFPKSWPSEPMLFHLWIFTVPQLLSNRSRKSVWIQLMPRWNKEPSPGETFSELMIMGLRRMTIMIPWLILPLLVTDS